MKINIRFAALLLGFLLAPQISLGSTPWYMIELILFTRNTPPGATGEIWSKTSGDLDWDSLRSGNYSLAPVGSWRLSGAELALKQAGGLTPVIHTAWQQPVYNRNAARPHYLKSDREIAPGTPLVEGMVKVSVSRYLHVNLDLLMRGAPAGAARLPGGFQTFRFNEHRRMRSRELHYIDHPLMGMLIMITPVSSAAPRHSENDAAQD